MTAVLNKKILLAGSVILAIAAIVAGATYAAWVATAEIEGNTLGAAELSITAVGAIGGDAIEKPIVADDILPGWTSWEESDPDAAHRALITNNSSIPLDLYFYIELEAGPQEACEAVALGWRSGQPGGGWATGYATPGAATVWYEEQPAGLWGGYTGTPESGLLSPILGFVGVDNAVKIADDTQFTPEGPTQVVAMRQIAHFATDASNDLQGTTCQWTEHFEGRIPS